MLAITAVSVAYTPQGQQSIMTVKSAGGVWDIPVGPETFNLLKELMEPRYHQTAQPPFQPVPSQPHVVNERMQSKFPVSTAEGPERLKVEVVVPEVKEETFGPMSSADRFREMVERQSKVLDAEPKDQGEQIPSRGGLGGLSGVNQL